ncbi:MAG: CHAT domain-containing protein [Blastocatellia bacterium]|nr:CHAT domain-containing protein [Blastocatellia bacterium]
MVPVRSVLLTVALLFSNSIWAQESTPLEPGKPVERTISSGQTHTYRLTLQAGQFVQFDVQQTSCDVALTLIAPDGKKLVEVDTTMYGLPETLSDIATTQGEYQLTVQVGRIGKMQGQYHLRIVRHDTPTEQDKQRITAERLMFGLYKGLNTQQRMDNAQQALTLWRALGERYWEAYLLSLISFVHSNEFKQHDKAIELTEQALAIVRELKDRASEAMLTANLGWFHLSKGLAYANKSEAFYEQALALYRAQGNKLGISDMLGRLAVLSKTMLKEESSKNYHEEALALNREMNNKQLQAAALFGLGQYYYGRAEYEKAFEYYDQQATIAQEIGDRLSLGNALRFKGMASYQLKKYDEAQKWLEQSLAILRELKMFPPHTYTLRELGRLNLIRGQREKADEYFNQALQVARATGNRMDDLTETNRVASAYGSYYLDETAMKLYETVLALARELKDQAWELSALANVGVTYLNTSQFEKYLASLEDRLSLSRKYGRKAEEVSTISGFCFAYVYPLKQPEKGIPYCEQALTLSRQHGYPTLENDSLTNLSTAWMNLHQYEKTNDYLNQALRLAQQQQDRIGEGKTLYFFSNLHGYLGQKAKAIEYAEQSLRTLKATPRKLAIVYEVLNSLGHLYQETGQIEKAIAMHEEAVNFIEGSDAKAFQLVAVQNLGYDHVKAGRYQKALEYFEAAQKDIGKDPLSQPYEWFSYFGSGTARRELKDYNRAIQDHLRALLLSQQYPFSRSEVGQVLEQLMKDWKAANNPAVAIFYGKQAINSYQDVRHSIRNLEKDLQQSFLKSKEQTYRELADLLISQGRLPEAEQVIRMLKEEEFYEYIRRDNKNAPKSEKAALTPEEAALDKRYREIADQLTAIGTERSALLDKKSRTADEEKQLAKLEEDLVVARTVFQKFLDQLSTELGKNKNRDSQIYNVQQSQALMEDLRELGKGTAALYTLVGEEKFRVILTTSDVQKAYEYPIKAAALNRKVLDFRAALQNPRIDPLPLAQELYKIVVAPLAKDLQAAKVETLMWSLDGVLRYMPIAALHDGKQYLVERFRNVVFTNESKARLKDEVSKNWRALGLGVTKSHGDKIPALPAVADEMRGIIREEGSQTGVLPGTIKLDDQFTLEAMKTGLRARPSVVHVASHFQFQPGNETDSALLLGDGQFLSLANIKTLPNVFGGVELLTLSACNTATGGSGANGKEIEGFGMLAQKQGAKAVVASLWPVADRSTKELMQAFYQSREANNTTKSEALRQSQLKLLRGDLVMTIDLMKREIVHETNTTANQPAYKVDPKKPYAHPYYWAPFILIGNWK